MSAMGLRDPHSIGAIYDHKVSTGEEEKAEVKRKRYSKRQFRLLIRKFTSRKEESRLHEESRA